MVGQQPVIVERPAEYVAEEEDSAGGIVTGDVAVEAFKLAYAAGGGALPGEADFAAFGHGHGRGAWNFSLLRVSN